MTMWQATMGRTGQGRRARTAALVPGLVALSTMLLPAAAQARKPALPAAMTDQFTLRLDTLSMVRKAVAAGASADSPQRGADPVLVGDPARSTIRSTLDEMLTINDDLRFVVGEDHGEASETMALGLQFARTF